MAADDGVLVGEEGDLGVPGAEQPGGQPGEPVEGGRAGDLDEQPAGGGDAVRVVQRSGPSVGVVRTWPRAPPSTRSARARRAHVRSC